MYSKALAHFRKVDPVLYSAAKKVGELSEPEPIAPEKYFVELCDTIISQQLSGKVAAVIWGRFLTLFPGEQITPIQILAIPDESIRAIGFSWAKIRYIKDLAARTRDKQIRFSDFPTLSEEEITRELVQVKGIGPWTAEMFLMFTMGKPDIFSYGDLGLRNAIKKLQGLQVPETWSPYRSYASRILWKSLELG